MKPELLKIGCVKNTKMTFSAILTMISSRASSFSFIFEFFRWKYIFSANKTHKNFDRTIEETLSKLGRLRCKIFIFEKFTLKIVLSFSSLNFTPRNIFFHLKNPGARVWVSWEKAQQKSAVTRGSRTREGRGRERERRERSLSISPPSRGHSLLFAASESSNSVRFGFHSKPKVHLKNRITRGTRWC